MEQKDCKQNGRKRGMIWAICGAAAAVVAAVIVVATVRANGAKTVGRDVPDADITAFYYTLSSSTDPATYQRYRFTAENGAYTFYHETREGSRWPLTEEDITVSGETALTPARWEALLACIRGGEVRPREEHLESGGRGPWLYLYWNGDRGKTQEFSFAGYESEQAFLRLCEALKAEG